MRIRASVFLTAIFLSVICSAANAVAGLKVLEGEHTVIYDIVNPRGVAFIPDYSNESFEQKVLNQDEFSKRVQVTAKMHALKSRTPFPIPSGAVPASFSQYLQPEKDRQSSDPSLQRLAKQITRDSRFTHEAANLILSWIADNLSFDTSISVPPDALSALKHKKAYCVGYSNLAVALLRAAGIPARVAHGYLPPGYEWGFSKDYWGVKVNDGGFHAYLEIFYPDTGWAFSDAEHSHNFVDPFHIILRLDGMDMPGRHRDGYLDVEKATFFTIFRDENNTLMVDELALPKEKRLGRRLNDRQNSALVTGRVSDANGVAILKGTAVLWKEGRGTPYPFTNGRYSAALEKPGKYRLELKGAGFTKSSRELQVEQGKVYNFDFALMPGAVIKGRVVDSAGRHLQDGDVFYRDGNASYGVPIEKDGTYRIEGLAPGQYKVSAMAGDREASRTTETEAGREAVLDFILK